MCFLSVRGLRATRCLVGLAGLGTGTALLVTGVGDAAVMVTLTAWGGFALLYLGLDVSWSRMWQGVPKPQGQAAGDPQEAMVRATDALREGANVVVQTAGVVLGLVAALATTVSPSLKVGSLALAAAILVTLILYGYVVSPLPARSSDTERMHVFVRYLFNAALLTLALGLLSVGVSIAFTG